MIGNGRFERGGRGYAFETCRLQCVQAPRLGVRDPVRQSVADMRVVGTVERRVEWQ